MLSVPHLIIIFIVALAVLGPEKLPQVARAVGKAMADFRRVTGDFRYQIESEMREIDRQTRLKELEQQNQNRIAAPAGTVPSGAPPGSATAEIDALVPPAVVSADPQNPYVQAEESAYTASLNLSAPYASPPAPEEAAALPPAAEENPAAEPPVEVAPAEHQKPGNVHS